MYTFQKAQQQKTATTTAVQQVYTTWLTLTHKQDLEVQTQIKQKKTCTSKHTKHAIDWPKIPLYQFLRRRWPRFATCVHGCYDWVMVCYAWVLRLFSCAWVSSHGLYLGLVARL